MLSFRSATAVRSTIAGAAAIALSLTGVAIAASPASADTQGPVAAPTWSASPDAAGWSNAPVTITWNWTDDDGLAADCPATSTSTGDGEQNITASCTDTVGNTGQGSVTVKVDTTGPVVASVTVSPQPNAAGWNNQRQVTVTWTWTDGGSGVDSSNCVTSAFRNRQGAGDAVAVCYDAVGNYSETRVPLRLDLTPPTFNPNLTTTPAPNVNGWNRTPVTVIWGWADALSGIDALRCPATTTVVDGGAQSANAECYDVAGNREGLSAQVYVDPNPPVAAPILSPAPNAAGWSTAVPTITWNWTDDYSGPAAAQCPATALAADQEGSQTVSGQCTDLADNIGTRTVDVRIDRLAPTLDPTLSPAEPAGGYAIGAIVTAAPNANDTTSGVASSSCGAVNTATAGTRTVDCTATDIAGNTADSSVSYTVAGTVVPDTQAPVAHPTRTPAANSAGWTTTDVTVTWNWTDDNSGLSAKCPATTTSTGEGAQTVSASCIDNAGNTGQGSLAVKVDTIAPAAAPTQLPLPNAAGWTKAATTVSWNWSDSRSGVNPAACPASTVVSADGVTPLSQSCADIAGNTADAHYEVKVDRTAPVLAPSLSSPVPTAGYAIGAVVTAAPNATDATSGIASSSCGPVDTTTAGTRTLTCTATDIAGNIANSSVSYSVAAPPDTQGPVAHPTRTPAANSAGWTNTGVTVTWNWTDDDSGLSSNCPATGTSTGEGAQTVSASCIDNAGNTGSGSVEVKVDPTAPTLAPTLSSPAPAAGYAIGAVVTATPNATDATSGIASSSCGPVDTTTAGTRTLTCTAADVAGNTASTTVSYTVAAAPVTPYSIAVTRPTAGASVKAGSTVPVQFTLTGANGKRLTVLQGLVLTLTCGAKVTIGTLPPACAIYNPLTGNFITAVTIPKTTAGGDLPVTVTVADRGATLATAATTIKVIR